MICACLMTQVLNAEFDKAQQAYESIRGVFPYSISGLENYSNILFIKVGLKQKRNTAIFRRNLQT